MAETAKASSTPLKRVSRACLFCRQRKSKCDLEASGGAPPCQRCVKNNRDCVLGSSNRGGRRERKKKLKFDGGANDAAWANASTSPSEPAHEPSTASGSRRDRPQTASLDHRNSESHSRNVVVERRDAPSPSGSIASAMELTMPKNVSDTWQLLKDVGGRNSNGLASRDSLSGAHDEDLPHESLSANGLDGLMAYRLIQDGKVSLDQVINLVADFKKYYHAYLPLVPKQYFQPGRLEYFAINNKHLFTAVLTIASKSSPGDRNVVHEHCCAYMQHLIAGIAAGVDCGVEAVEALLLLAEWVPQGLRASGGAVGRGEEDRTAWMHVGMALRTGYYLGLDHTSFRNEETEEPKSTSRRRLAWTSCYVSDRLVSCRIGKAFWSRGPGPMTDLSSNDFPTLQPSGPGDEDHARIFKAILDLTQIYSNVHEILYSATRANQMLLMGDYIKYIDEFHNSICRWHERWGSLLCSPHIKVTLDLSYQYLQLYTNAFAFQAAISQAMTKGTKEGKPPTRDDLRRLFRNIGSMPDARFIFRSIEAAKQYLVIFNTYVDAETQLRYMPIRFYLYCIYCAVFLYKARSYDALPGSEEPRVREMIAATIQKLREASAPSPNDTAARYARLLELLWHKSKPSRKDEEDAASHLSRHAHTPQPPSPRQSDLGSTGFYGISPANGFSWLDLGGTADFASAAEHFTNSGMLSESHVGVLQAGVEYMPQQMHGMEYDQQYRLPGEFDLNYNLPF